MEITVKMTGDTFIARCQGKTASCTAGPEQAARAVARKVLGKPSASVDLARRPYKRYGYTRWEAIQLDQVTEQHDSNEVSKLIWDLANQVVVGKHKRWDSRHVPGIRAAAMYLDEVAAPAAERVEPVTIDDITVSPDCETDEMVEACIAVFRNAGSKVDLGYLGQACRAYLREFQRSNPPAQAARVPDGFTLVPNEALGKFKSAQNAVSAAVPYLISEGLSLVMTAAPDHDQAKEA